MSNGPAEIFVIVNKVTGELKTGGGSSTKASSRAFATEQEAIWSLDRIRNKTDLVIAKYKVVNPNLLERKYG